MNKKSMILFIFIVTIILFANVFIGEVRANTSYLLVTANTIPGCDPLNNGPALCFKFDGTGTLSPLPSIPESYLNSPTYVVFNHQGELFIGNRHCCIGGGVGSIARFLLNNTGNFIPNGIIEGNGLERVTGLAFSSTGELFAASSRNGTISRFLFDENGDAIPNGNFYIGEVINQGLAFNSKGELFTTHDSSEVNRFIFNDNGEAIFNGSFYISGSSRLHGLSFNDQGELFIGDPSTNLIYRILFDDTGNPIPNGSISVQGGAVGGIFSPEGEFFATSHFEGRITRFLFDENGLPIPNGSIVPNCDHLGGIAIFAFPPAAPIALAEPGLDENKLLILDGSLSSDPYKTIISWNWTLINRDPSGNNFTLVGEIVPTIDLDVGIYDVTLAVTNNEELVGIDAMVLAIPKCTTTDLDNDSYSVEMGDCDDNDPEIHPGSDPKRGR